MPTTQSAKKRLRQNEKRRLRNRSLRSRIKTTSRKLHELESPEGAEELLAELYTLLDKAARKRVLHPNAADRRKARAARHVRRLREG